MARTFYLNGMYKAGDRNKFLFGRHRIIFCLWNIPVESQIIALCQKDIEVMVTVGTGIEYGRDIDRFIFFSSFCHFFRCGNVSVVSDTTVLIRFQIVVAIDSLHLIAVANVTTEKRGIKIRSVLIIIVASAIQIINIKAESQLLVYID